MKSKSKPKPCPFCGSVHLSVLDFESRYRVECNFCKARTGIWNSERDAIDAWNKRVEPTFTHDEIEPFCRKILLRRQRDGILPRFPVWDDVRTFDGRPWRGKVDCICGGFPCQDISAAGKGAGIDGARSGLWSEFARIIGEIRPQYAFVENSPMLISRRLGRVLGDLSSLGYDTKWLVMGADDVGARTVASESGYWRIPTPLASDGSEQQANSKVRHIRNAKFGARVRSVPYWILKNYNMRSTPTMSEWLMGYPISWTDSAPLATDKFLLWRRF